MPEKDVQIGRGMIVTGQTAIFIGAPVDVIQTNGDDDDLYDITLAADESVVSMWFVADTEQNREILARHNSVNSLDDTNTPRGTTYFQPYSTTYDDILDLELYQDGMIMEVALANSQAVKVGNRAAHAGSGKFKLFDEATPDAPAAAHGRFLSQHTSQAALKWAILKVGR
jgi:hypothetical protein